VQRDILDGPATPDRIGRLAAAGALTGDDVARAYAAASATPARPGWALLVDRTLLVLGALLAVAGVIFFFAYNWAKLPSSGKFGLIGAGIVLSVAAAQQRTLARLGGRMALVVAALLVGPLLAVYGQTYQTGADPYELFLTWALLATPWAIAARSSLLWGVIIALADITAGLFAEQVLRENDVSPWRDGAELLLVAGIHLVALAAVELAAKEDRKLARIVALVGAGAVSFGAMWWVFDKGRFLIAPALCAASAPFVWGAMILVYRRLRRDMAMLAIAGASIVAVITSVIGRVLSEGTNSWVAIVFFTGLALTGEVAAVAFWLRGEMKRGEEA
jgi:uncharacterized membrane protein